MLIWITMVMINPKKNRYYLGWDQYSLICWPGYLLSQIITFVLSCSNFNLLSKCSIYVLALLTVYLVYRCSPRLSLLFFHDPFILLILAIWNWQKNIIFVVPWQLPLCYSLLSTAIMLFPIREKGKVWLKNLVLFISSVSCNK